VLALLAFHRDRRYINSKLNGTVHPTGLITVDQAQILQTRTGLHHPELGLRQSKFRSSLKKAM